MPENYPKQEWIHIYTDGSSFHGTGKTAAGTGKNELVINAIFFKDIEL